MDEKYKEARILILKYLAKHIQDSNITFKYIADNTGLKLSTIERFFEGKFNPSLEQLLFITDIIGIKINFTPKQKTNDSI